MLISTSDHRSARRSRKSTSNRPPIFAASPKIAEKPKRQTRWTLFPVAAKNARILGTFSSAAPSIEQLLLPLSSESGQALRIRWTYHPCGFESHHRHHKTPVFTGVLSFLELKKGVLIRHACHRQIAVFRIFHPSFLQQLRAFSDFRRSIRRSVAPLRLPFDPEKRP